MPIINLNNVSFSYLNGNTPFNFENINITVGKGDFLTIMGPNGSGKSTLLNLISGIYLPETGEITLENIPLNRFTKKQIARKIAFVPQTTYSAFPFSVYEIVMMGRTPYLNLFGLENNDDHNKVIEALRIMEIENLKNKGINEVSGGEAQRAFIARALAQDTEIILLDEPNAHLDLQHQLSIFNLLCRLNLEKNLTIIMVSHDLILSGFYSTRTILMREGKIFKDGLTREVLNEENIQQTFGVNASVKYSEKFDNVIISINPEHPKADG